MLLSAFAYQAVEAERRYRLAERALRLQDKAESVMREVDKELRDAGQRVGTQVKGLRDLGRACDAGSRLLRGLPREATPDGLLVLDRAGRRVWPQPGRAPAASAVRMQQLGGNAGGLFGARVAHMPMLLFQAAVALGPGQRERDEAISLLERVVRSSPDLELRASALWELARLHQSAANLPGALNAVEAYRELAALPIELVDHRGQNTPAQARIQLARIQSQLGRRKAYLDGLRGLVDELEKNPWLLPADVVADLSERAGTLLELEGEGQAALLRARVLSTRRQQQEQACQRIEEQFAPGLRQVLRDALRGGEEVVFLKERSGDRYELVACCAIPSSKAGQPLGLAVVPMSEETLLRSWNEAVRRFDGAELIGYPSGLATGPEVQEAALRPPLEHMGVRVHAPATEEPLELMEGVSVTQDTVRLWAIALSIGGILAGVFVTVRTVRRESKAAQLKSDWVSNVTHELKTPLTSIRMFLETLLLGRVEDEAEARECLQVMSREADRLTRLIDQLLAFSRIENKKIRLRLGFESPRGLVEEAIRILADQQGKQPEALGIEVVMVQDLPAIAVDKIAVIEAILNLLHNAWKYSPGPERRLRVVLTDRRRMIEVAVEDNGIGVPRRDRRRIFVKFERGTNAEAARIEGSGIGLTVADTIVRAHGGRIEYAPLKPRGSRFSMFLPK